MDKVLIIDGHNFLWRANVSFKPPVKEAAPPPIDVWGFENPNQSTVKPPSEEFIVIFNFFRNLRPVIEQFAPTKCFFVLEGHPQFRYDLFADYKSNRRLIKTGSQQESRDKLYKHKDTIVSLLKHLPITVAKAEHYECDDVVATLAENMKDEDVTILSNDSDFLQILQKGFTNVKVYNPYKKDYMVAPDYHYIAWKALSGDKSDSIPGMMGDKTAQKTIADPKKLEKFLELEEHRAQFSINRQLIEFRQVPMDEIKIDEGVANFDILKQEFTKMEFNSIVNDKSWKKYVDTFNCLRL